ncbi:exported hypothetical protein [Cupriavidus oxalaticus]|uniref:Uncharacterized protein n=1 Tax=Cupriavidus oxalaticus TaxID=96344 RepID=A0A375GFF5_9BURK|nr:exported hypothetical protein [Cupriavidus oxalaticus]
MPQGAWPHKVIGCAPSLPTLSAAHACALAHPGRGLFLFGLHSKSAHRLQINHMAHIKPYVHCLTFPIQSADGDGTGIAGEQRDQRP